MATSRKSTRELKKLRSDAAGIWGEQRELLGHAGEFWKAVGAEAAERAKNDLAPRVKAAYDAQVKPAVSTGVANASVAATHAKDRLKNDVAPAVSAAVASSPLAEHIDLDELLKSGKKLSKKAKRKALKKAAQQARKHPKATKNIAKTVLKAKKLQKKTQKNKGLGKGGVFLIILGVVGLGAVIYAAAQTLRADDELWVADDEDSPKA
ncbi:hypothetical protein [Frondihabitans sp. VKM Ac-2883]|uniref:hypothetical protein n=1 Tax=Frondihabitans sp. VKM Ac-2883 TaxID=2783823 RepID=UPI00188B2255|nr:hypothetical protein [Frondihabitans sp. VKM Ac-2883]MBF4575150.1 hypothetical protein [Frondihabitans sp. VKM Ac-2883]